MLLAAHGVPPDALARLSVVKGSPADVPAMAAAMRGHDAVLSALAPTPGEVFSSPESRTWTMAGYADNIAKAMATAGVSRLIVFTSGGLFPDRSCWIRLLSAMVRHHLADLRAMEGVVSKTALAWTIARPGWLKEGAAIEYRATAEGENEDERTLTFDGLARFMLDAAAAGTFTRKIVGVSL